MLATCNLTSVRPDVRSVGALFEGWIAQLLRAYSDYRDLCDEIAYWQPAEATQTEVDFILRRGSEIVAIEANASRRWRPEFAKGLRAIAELPEVSRRIVVYLGSRTLRMDDGIDVLPLGRFLDELAAGFWSPLPPWRGSSYRARMSKLLSIGTGSGR